ncbi:TPA: DUF4352 domain-containing protein [Clostridium perfringens]|nr:hypothetical protein CPBEC3_16020 [Clostridium perfringens]BDA35912.1 hypothetical protein CPBEC5_29200 [Clostridium perfringens]HCG3020012.1 DUF4352 domain-containing protein [Clostridium perfringens]HCG3173587.1 DUF4352 domain-containing protein [Clostridium perfringens]
MNKEKLKSLFTSKIAIGIISFIIGGIALGNSSSGVNITKERYNQLLEFEKVALQKEGEALETLNEELNEENLDNKINEKTEEDKRPLSIGETAYINDENGVKSMAITIDNVKLTDERNQFSEKEAEKVVVIEYTYENIADEENLYVFDSNFKVYDASGNVLETYPAGAEKYPQSISKGKKCTANMSFALNNESNNLELEFYDNMFNGKASEVFNISVE